MIGKFVITLLSILIIHGVASVNINFVEFYGRNGFNAVIDPIPVERNLTSGWEMLLSFNSRIRDLSVSMP